MFSKVSLFATTMFTSTQKSINCFRIRLVGFQIGCVNAKTCTLILRGGSEQFLEETERSLHDAIMIVRRTIKNDSVVAGGGAIEMELSKMLRDHSRTIAGKEQLLIGAIAKALEIVPRQLCDNAGFDATNILNKLRQKHAQGKFLHALPCRLESIYFCFIAFLQVIAGTVWTLARNTLPIISKHASGSRQSLN